MYDEYDERVCAGDLGVSAHEYYDERDHYDDKGFARECYRVAMSVTGWRRHIRSLKL